MPLGISILYGNVLQVNHELLRAENCSPRELENILVLGRSAILHAIDTMYEQYSLFREVEAITNPNIAPVQRGSVYVMQLATKRERVITPEAIAQDRTSQYNRGVFSQGSAMMPAFRPFWEAVEAAAFIPEVRTTRATSRKNGEVVDLLVRDVPLVAPD